MYAPSLRKRHLFDHSITLVKHHQKLAEALLLLVFIGLIAVVTTHVESLYAPEIGLETEMSRIVAGKPLTRLTDPAYAHEYPVREAYITTHLERLRDASQVDRAYVAIYEYTASKIHGGIDQQIFDVVEVRRVRIAPRFEDFHGMPREHWLQIHQDARTLSSLFVNVFQSDGLELYNEHDVPIGYIGIERQQGYALFRDQEIAQLRETATVIEQGLTRASPIP